MILDTAESLSNIMHLITLIATPLHIFGTYCIVFKTPKNMRSTKWYIFNLHFSCMMLDWGATVLTIPFVLFPAMAGYAVGILSNWFGVSTVVQTYLIVTLVFVVCSSIVVIFENRYYQLYGRESKWKYLRVPFIVANYIFTFTVFLPACLSYPEQKMALEFTYAQIPSLPEEIKAGPIFVLSIEYWVQIPFNLMCVLVAGESFFFIGLINRNMNSTTRGVNLSENTMKMQRRFLKAVYAQVVVFLINFLFPMTYLIVSILANYYNQFGNNMIFIIGALHGINSTLVMLWAHKPYKEVCLNLIKKGRSLVKLPNPVVRSTQPIVSATVLI